MINKIDKTKFSIRPIAASDKESLQAGLAMLSHESKRQRFFSGRKGLTDKELTYFTEVDQHNHIAFVAIFTDDNTAVPAGSVRCIRNPERPEYAELAITIIDQFHHQGLGYHLLETLAASAIKENITHLYGDFHASNGNMLKLLDKYRFRHNIPSDSFHIIHNNDGFLYFEMALA
ncbi:MAG: GNAT family N-acetyltransferase [Bacteriovorax sp.]|nr:GNAT family N-acetyltransferase [Bacteriovorax sp.]